MRIEGVVINHGVQIPFEIGFFAIILKYLILGHPVFLFYVFHCPFNVSILFLGLFLIYLSGES